VNILARAFYALGDTMTPMRISVFSLAVNAALALALVYPFRQMGLGIANTCSAILNFSLLLYALRRKIKTLDLEALYAASRSPGCRHRGWIRRVGLASSGAPDSDTPAFFSD
jgi:peptidoglycan biosynthesis protein MviN/MurJ (putative lipid II flippase)